MTRVNENITLLDNGIGVTDDGRLVQFVDKKFLPIIQPGAAGIHADGCSQLTAYGKVEFYNTPGRNVLAKQTFSADGRTCWVPMTGRRVTKPKREKVSASAAKGETLFNPAEFPGGTRHGF